MAVVALALLFGSTGSEGGQLGSLGVTLVYVFGGVTVQYLIGLGLAFLCAQKLAGQRFFRVVFFIPMMITPVGIAYTFRMLTDTSKGPFAPLWQSSRAEPWLRVRCDLGVRSTAGKLHWS